MTTSPNNTCDIYRAGNAPPAAPDVAAVPCFLTNCFDLGRERGEKEAQQFRFTSILTVAPTTDIRDDFNDWGGSASNRDTVYIPDKNGIGYVVNFVERVQRGSSADQLRAYLDRLSVPWPYPPTTPTSPSGGSGSCLVFPGTSNSTIVSLGNVISPTASIAISLWIKTTQNTRFPGLISKWANSVFSTTNYQYLLFLSAGQVFFETTPDGTTPSFVLSNGSVADGRWHHIVAKCKAGANGVQIWIDGALDNQANGAGGIQTSTDNLVFGAWGIAAASYPYAGEMTQILIANDLSSEQIAELFGEGTPPSSLPGDISGVLGYWPCSEGSGSTLGDHSGNGHNGAIGSGVTWSTDYP